MKKQSAKRNSSAPLDDVSLFIDRSLGQRVVPDALRAAGFPIVVHDECFAQTATDEEWLAQAGARGWVVVSRDLSIRRKRNELAALKAANVVAFFITGGNLGGQALAELMLKAGRRIQQCAKTTRPPAAFSVSKDGTIKRLNL